MNQMKATTKAQLSVIFARGWLANLCHRSPLTGGPENDQFQTGSDQRGRRLDS